LLSATIRAHHELNEVKSKLSIMQLETAEHNRFVLLEFYLVKVLSEPVFTNEALSDLHLKNNYLLQKLLQVR
jgi:hypothetical protein